MIKNTTILILTLIFLLISEGCSNDKNKSLHAQTMNHVNHLEMNMEDMDKMDENKPIMETKDKPEVPQQEIGNSLKKWYEKNINGQHVKIAILDTGIDRKNKDLSYVNGINFTTKEANKFDDDNGHGTKIAGIIGARKNNYNLLGVAPECDLYIVKVADENGNVKFENLVKGINWAIEQKVDIINISLEFPKKNSRLHEVIKKAADKNIIIVSSSGNIQFPGDVHISYPGGYPEVISVGMLNTKGKIYAKEFKKKKVDVFAPGEDIITLYFNNKMTLDTGVSFSTAYTSGYAALLIQEHRLNGEGYNKEQIKKELQSNLQEKM